ncbi:hypothetical protein FOL47_000814, partial [Perkinsus chesapeaki]
MPLIPPGAQKEAEDSDHNPPTTPINMREYRKEPREELKASGHSVWKPTEGGTSFAEHLVSMERLMHMIGISMSSPAAYFLLLYSVDSSVRDGLPPCDLTPGSPGELYECLKAELKQHHSDPTDVLALRHSFNTLVQGTSVSLTEHLSIIDDLVNRLRLQGDTPMSPDWALAYRLDGVSLNEARLRMTGRAKHHERRPPTQLFRQFPLEETAAAAATTTATEERLVLDYGRLAREGRYFRCLERNHSAVRCTKGLPAFLSRRCLCCGRTGHQRSDCRLLIGKKTVCGRCGQQGHTPAVCRSPPKESKEGDGKTGGKTTTEETGAATTVVVQGAQSAKGNYSEEKNNHRSDDSENEDCTKPSNTSWLHMVLDDPCEAALTDPTTCHGTSLYTDELSDPTPLITDIKLLPEDCQDSGHSSKALVDTGAGRSFIRSSTLSSLPESLIVERRDVQVSVMVAYKEKFICSKAVLLNVDTPQLTKPIWFLIVKDLSFPLILGLDAIRRLRLLIYASPEAVLLEAGVNEHVVRQCAGNGKQHAVHAEANRSHFHCYPGDVVLSNEVADDESSSEKYEVDSNLVMQGAVEERTPSFDEAYWSNFGHHQDEERALNFHSSRVPLNGVSAECSSKFCSSEKDSLFIGYTRDDNHVNEDDSTSSVQRFTYRVPWVRRLPKPSIREIGKAIDRDDARRNRLEKSGQLVSYAQVFDTYIDKRILVEVDETDYSKVTGILNHFPVARDSSPTTPVRPVLNGSIYRGVVGTGFKNKKQEDAGSPPQKVLGMLWMPGDQLKNTSGPDLPPPVLMRDSNAGHGTERAATTCRDLMSIIAK